ncbi:MAG: S-layer homology domain-containing protein, partial [Bacteroidales bacterium]|nr:S-layer homology domain-containing protein [Bacteroidales bacterium]
ACKRSEFIIALWKSLGSPATQPLAIYTDTQNHETEIGKAVGWAYMNGIMGGTGKLKFSPDKTLTRAQVLIYLNRTIK